MPLVSEKFTGLKPKRRRPGKQKRKHLHVEDETKKPADVAEQATVFYFNSDDVCEACDPARRRIITESLLEIQLWPDGSNKIASHNSLSTGWSSDLVNLALCRKGRTANSNSSGRMKQDGKMIKSTLHGANKSCKYLTAFKHLDDMDAYIAQYRQPKCTELTQLQGRPSFTHVANMNAHFRAGSGNPVSSRFKWLCGVSKSVHSRIFAENAKIVQSTLVSAPGAQLKPEKRKSMESLLSHDLQSAGEALNSAKVSDRVETMSRMEYLNGIGIISTPSPLACTSKQLVRSHGPSFDAPCVSHTSLVSESSEDSDTLWMLEGTAIRL
ncbi:hypothetical protein D915_001337 [Fasciola hepatica]|uniref:Uncharacterized protein n=1 Tax=Fasciola hepatica TaxID=6192 RepID=A0A2H1CSQ4_FASHE|nr:hypothetical protein D915_001337 [Fasciola hepatica]